MREIKFRVWDKKEKRMLYYDRDIVPNMTITGVLITDRGKNVSDRYTAMQYIGLRDSNNVELCEGDIVKRHRFDRGTEVVWHEDGAFFDFEDPTSFILNKALSKDYVVVGNRFENKDLL